MSSGDEPPRMGGATHWSDDTYDAGSTLGPGGVAPPDGEASLVDRYTDLGLIGRGGMGEVRRVYDRVLDRAVAMKILGHALLDNAVARRRFMSEAGITAGLQHPGIVPVHERGELADGRLWYTMREVRGRTLAQVVETVHATSGDGGWRASHDGWSLRRLVEVLLRVTEAIAYAHREGIIHRDLKPQNIMVGAFGEVQVMDWGLATRIDRSPDTDRPFETPETAPTDPVTISSQIVGTPAYMPPEQAMGVEPLTRASDVYALGGVLYQILTGVPPFIGTAQSVWRRTIESPPLPVRQRVAVEHPPLPDELVAICAHAMERAPEDRYPDGTAMARALRSWLDGERRREEAAAIVEEATGLLPEARTLRERARTLRSRADAALSELAGHDPPEKRYDAWALQDEASEFERRAALIEVDWEQHMRSALTRFPEFIRAHDLLADFYREALEAAESARNREDAARFEALLRMHDRGRHVSFLKGEGRLTLHTSPSGARARLYRFVETNRRLEPHFERDLGVTPLVDVALPYGSFVMRLEADGHAPVDYPFHLERGGRWDGVRPGEDAPHPIRLPRIGEIGEDEVYVPAGWFWSGGDPDAIDGLPRRRVWVDGFVMGRFPIMQRAYLAFVNALVDDDRLAEALRYVPRRLVSEAKSLPDYDRDDTGHFVLGSEPAGQSLDEPVHQIDWYSAMAYAAWRAKVTGAGYRLPHEFEREKATRGVDGRFYPWGDTASAPWACALDTVPNIHPPRYLPTGTFPQDVSPYGARGVAGNVRDWCINAWQHDGPELDAGRLVVTVSDDVDPDDYRTTKGGSWMANLRTGRAAARFADRPHQRFTVLGMRIVRPFDL